MTRTGRSDHLGEQAYDRHGPLNARTATDAFFGAAGVIVVIVIAVAFLFGLTGCTGSAVNPGPDSGNTRQSIPGPDAKTIQQATYRVCAAFAGYSLEDLNRAAAEGQIDYLAGLQGVPPTLADAVTGYWDDGRVRSLDKPDNRAVADQRYGQVLATCKDHGWTRGMQASDQPSKK